MLKLCENSVLTMQTIVTAMNNLVPPVQLACPANQLRIEYILNLTNQKDFEFTPVRINIICFCLFFGEGLFFYKVVLWLCFDFMCLVEIQTCSKYNGLTKLH